VRRFLQALPPKFEQIATSIETLLDLEMMSVDELTGHLKPTEERLNLSNSKAITSLNLTEDELVAQLSSWLKISGNGGSDCSKEASSSGSKRGHGRGRGRGSNTGGHTGCDRTTSKMRGLSPKIISGDSRRSENAQTHTNKHTIPNMKFRLKLLQIKCRVLGFTKVKAPKCASKELIRVLRKRLSLTIGTRSSP
jgi:hypothetical protein